MLRFAPSPTTDMNLGSLRIALFNYIISQQKNEDFIVRFEDTDKKQNIEGIDKETLDLLTLFNIKYSQVIYQSENVRFHTAMALQLMHEKKAFSCFCSPDWLEKKHEEAKANKKLYKYDDACRNLPDELVLDNTNPFTIRIKKPDETSTDIQNMDSFVIMDQNKIPTYNFACAVDDMLSDISVVIRSEEHKSNTAKQNHVRESLGYEKDVQYVHLPIISNDPSVKGLLEEGFLPEAILNYLVSIGNKVPCEIFTMAEAIEYFDLSEVSKSPIEFDITILRNINHKYLNQLDDKELSRYVGFADEEIGKLAKVYLEEVSTTKELKSKISAIFAQKEIPQEFSETAKTIAQTVKKAPYFEKYDELEKYILNETGLKAEKLSEPLRYLLTGSKNGPDIANIYKYLKNYIGEIIK